MDAQMNAVLEGINEKLDADWEVEDASEEAVVEGVVAVEPAPLDAYLEGIVSILSERFGAELSESRDAVKEAVVEMVRLGALPELPGEEVDDQELWIEHAHTMGLIGAALRSFELDEDEDGLAQQEMLGQFPPEPSKKKKAAARKAAVAAYKAAVKSGDKKALEKALFAMHHAGIDLTKHL